MKYAIILSGAIASIIILISLSLFLYISEKKISYRTGEEITKLHEVMTTETNILGAFLRYSQKVPNKEYALSYEAIKTDSKNNISLLREHNNYLENLMIQRWKNLSIIFISFIAAIAGIAFSLCAIIYHDKMTTQTEKPQQKPRSKGRKASSNA